MTRRPRRRCFEPSVGASGSTSGRVDRSDTRLSCPSCSTHRASRCRGIARAVVLGARRELSLLGLDPWSSGPCLDRRVLRARLVLGARLVRDAGLVVRRGGRCSGDRPSEGAVLRPRRSRRGSDPECQSVPASARAAMRVFALCNMVLSFRPDRVLFPASHLRCVTAGKGPAKRHHLARQQLGKATVCAVRARAREMRAAVGSGPERRSRPRARHAVPLAQRPRPPAPVGALPCELGKLDAPVAPQQPLPRDRMLRRPWEESLDDPVHEVGRAARTSRRARHRCRSCAPASRRTPSRRTRHVRLPRGVEPAVARRARLTHAGQDLGRGAEHAEQCRDRRVRLPVSRSDALGGSGREVRRIVRAARSRCDRVSCGSPTRDRSAFTDQSASA